MPNIDRNRISRLAAPAALGLAIAIGASACGGSPTASQTTSATTAVSPAKKVAEQQRGETSTTQKNPASITTVKPPPVTPTFLDIQACRSFVSFKDFAEGGGDTAVMAKGEVGGMIVEAQEASQKAGGKGAPAKILGDLQALLTATKSKQWTGRGSEAKLPQVTALVADCKPVLS